MHIGLPSPSHDEHDTAFSYQADDDDNNSFDNISNLSSTSYDPSHNTATLPAKNE